MGDPKDFMIIIHLFQEEEEEEKRSAPFFPHFYLCGDAKL